tara:strand:- start:753 stop:1391 length:639 start_codon:yes stop_codon:yes gene_type:complete
MKKIIVIKKNSNYWNKFYRKEDQFYESNFAKFAWRYLKKNNNLNIADIGCGDGRDSFFFLKKDLKLFGYDKSKTAINKNIKKFGNFFINKDFCRRNINIKKKYDVLYMRFFIHAINDNMERNLLSNLKKISHKKSIFFFEFRTINDPLINKGTKISKYERYTSHYRRFIDTEKFISSLKDKKIKVIYKKTSNKFSVTKNDVPEISRIVAKNV